MRGLAELPDLQALFDPALRLYLAALIRHMSQTGL